MAYTKNMKLEDFLSDHQVKEVKEITHPFIKVKLRTDYVFIEMQDEKNSFIRADRRPLSADACRAFYRVSHSQTVPRAAVLI